VKAEYITPAICVFDDEGNVDYDGCARIIDRVVSAGIDGVVLNGSNGEFFHLTDEERCRLVDAAVEVIDHRAKLYVGTGSMSQEQTIKLTRYAHEAGADAALVVPPFYFKLAEQSMEEFFSAVASSSDGDVLLYNFPTLTGNDVAPELAARLVDKHENIVGYKDTVVDVAHTRRVIDAVSPIRSEFLAYSGFDENLAHNILAGGAGTIGALSNLVPATCVAWTGAINAGDWNEVARYQRIIDRLMALYDISQPFMSTFRYALHLVGFDMNENCRAPFLAIDEEQKAKTRALLESLEII